MSESTREWAAATIKDAVLEAMKDGRFVREQTCEARQEAMTADIAAKTELIQKDTTEILKATAPIPQIQETLNTHLIEHQTRDRVIRWGLVLLGSAGTALGILKTTGVL